jgi:hypothetical protein
MARKARLLIIDGGSRTTSPNGPGLSTAPTSGNTTRDGRFLVVRRRIRTGKTVTPFQFVGTLGYYAESPSDAGYVRARVDIFSCFRRQLECEGSKQPVPVIQGRQYMPRAALEETRVLYIPAGERIASLLHTNT